jgi:hypothetical protein
VPTRQRAPVDSTRRAQRSTGIKRRYGDNDFALFANFYCGFCKIYFLENFLKTPFLQAMLEAAESVELEELLECIITAEDARVDTPGQTDDETVIVDALTAAKCVDVVVDREELIFSGCDAMEPGSDENNITSQASTANDVAKASRLNLMEESLVKTTLAKNDEMDDEEILTQITQKLYANSPDNTVAQAPVDESCVEAKSGVYATDIDACIDCVVVCEEIDAEYFQSWTKVITPPVFEQKMEQQDDVVLPDSNEKSFSTKKRQKTLKTAKMSRKQKQRSHSALSSDGEVKRMKTPNKKPKSAAAESSGDEPDWRIEVKRVKTPPAAPAKPKERQCVSCECTINEQTCSLGLSSLYCSRDCVKVQTEKAAAVTAAGSDFVIVFDEATGLLTVCYYSLYYLL